MAPNPPPTPTDPLQSPRNVTGSRSGLLKCFVRREHGPGGKRFTFHIGKDAAQPQRSRFLMAAKPVRGLYGCVAAGWGAGITGMGCSPSPPAS